MTFAPIFTTFSRSVVSDQRSTSSGRTRVRKKCKRREDHEFEGLLTAPAYRAVFVQLTRSEVRERSSLEAALFVLLAAAAWAGIVAPNILERVNKRQRRVGKGQTGIPPTGGPPLLIPLGRIREGVPARELANGIL